MSDITPTVTLVDGTPRVSSLDIAERFGKAHKDVLRVISKIIADLPADFNERNFTLVEFTDAKGEKRPMYNLTRDAFSLVAMGFTGKEALAWKVRYIEAFNAMEKELVKRLAPKRGRKVAQKGLPTNWPRFTPRTSLEEIEARLNDLCLYVQKERQSIYVDLLNQFCTIHTPRLSTMTIVCSSLSSAIFDQINECISSCSDTPVRFSNPCTLVRDVKAMMEALQS